MTWNNETFFITLTDYISIVKIVRRFKLFAKKSLKSRFSRSQKFAKKNTDSKVSQEAAKKANQPKKPSQPRLLWKKPKDIKVPGSSKSVSFPHIAALEEAGPGKVLQYRAQNLVFSSP